MTFSNSDQTRSPHSGPTASPSVPLATKPAAPTQPLPSLNEVPIDSILFVSFGGPEGPDDVIPFLENVLRGKNVPRERMLEVANHYQRFGGVSPINEQCRLLIDAIQKECLDRGIKLPIYWGNRNWTPMLPATLQRMADDGRKRAIAFFTSMFSCYSGCRQYREDIAVAQSIVGDKAPLVEKVRKGFNHPKFIAAQSDCLIKALAQIPEEHRTTTKVLFCAHSIPNAMADHSNYEIQLRECAQLICNNVGHSPWELVFQSRSGPPQQPWLEPDVVDRIEQLHSEESLQRVVLMPIGFISDHIEVLYDLDEEAATFCRENDIQFVRGKTVGVHPMFVSMIVDLLQERLAEGTERPSIGSYGASHDLCPTNCCLYPVSRPTR